jgi:hypothetical protein
MAGGKGIRRIIELALDAASARRMRDEAQRALAEGTDPKKAQRNLSAAERAIDRVKDAAMKLGGALVAAFAINKIVQFGEACVRAAMEAQSGWASLTNTLNNVGVSIDEQRVRIEAHAKAIMDATVFDDDDVFAGMNALVRVSGDYEGSLARIGLVADVASAKQISMSEAGELVGRVMAGQTRGLREFGISAHDAESGLDTLAQRLAGTAANEAQTFSGQLKIINRDWGNFQEEVGGALIAGGQASSVMSTLRGVIGGLTGAVHQNREGFAAFVRAGINVAIVALEVVVNSFRYLSQTLSGKLLGAIGMAVGAWASMVEVLALAIDARVKWNELTGDAVEAAHFRAESERLHARADELKRLADAYRNVANEQFHWLSLRGPAGTTTTPPTGGTRGNGGGGGGGGTTGAGGRGRAAPLPALPERTPNLEAPGMGPIAGIVGTIDATENRTREFFDNISLHSEQTGQDIADNMSRAFQEVLEEGLTVGSAFGAIWQGVAGVAGDALKEFFIGKAKQNFTQAIEDFADAAKAAFTPGLQGMVPGLLAAGAKHMAVGSAWAALAGGAGAAAPRGGGGVGHGGYRADGRQTANQADRPGAEFHIYVDGFEGGNPRHQDMLAVGMRGVVERHGADWANARITVHPRRG